MKRKIFSLGLVVLTLSISLWIWQRTRPESMRRNHPARQIAQWHSSLNKPLKERIIWQKKEVKSLLTLVSLFQSSQQRPLPVEKPQVIKVFKQNVAKIIQRLPMNMQRLLQKRLAAIVPLRGLKSSGMSVDLFDGQGQPKAGIVVIDVDKVSFPANKWASFNAGTPFNLKHYSIDVTLAEKDQDSDELALQYQITHEFAHIVSYFSRWHPPNHYEPKKTEVFPAYSFPALSWEIRSKKVVRKGSPLFDDLNRLNFYSHKSQRLTENHLPKFYELLKKTSFPTLLAATSFSDDFAESFANYFHVVHLNLPFRIDVYKGSKLILSQQSCWMEKRCQPKKRFLSQFF